MHSTRFVLLAGFLLLVHGAEDSSSPDLISMVTKLQSDVRALQDQNQDLQTQVQTLETGLAQLRNSSVVAFFVGLFSEEGRMANYGPFDVDTVIKYRKVYTNIGDAYDAESGVFKAPVSGLYVFHYSMYNSMVGTPRSAAVLMKNIEVLALAFDVSTSDPQDVATRVAVVTLEAGDQVYVVQSKHTFVYDNAGNLNSFSGFLLSSI